ncbi:right-handed parallel beta-helix repeat-containing protein [bacterium]|nr:right-handed parallel beta-helix repeat-containing protein [candidate division CSSED10-310 bacterium]
MRREGLLPVVLLLAVVQGHAAHIHVPADQPTIQAGIDAAVHGDTVIVANGTYAGAGFRDITFNGKEITVRAADDTFSCEIDCEDLGRGFLFDHAETASSVLQGLVIRDGTGGAGGGIYCNNASPTIERCRIIDCNATSGGGIGCESTASPTISNCSISDCEAATGGGIAMNDFCSPYIRDTTMAFNLAVDGAGVSVGYACSPVLERVNINRNEATSLGGGLNGSYCAVEIIGSNVSDNRASKGGGLTLFESVPSITGTVIAMNSGFGEGGAIYCNRTALDMQRCELSGNFAAYGAGIYLLACTDVTVAGTVFSANVAVVGGGFHCQLGSSPEFYNCLFFNNNVVNFGAGGWAESSAPWLENCTLADNSSTHGGALFCSSEPAPTLLNCILWGNTPEAIYTSGMAPAITYSDVEGGFAGNGNINTDPYFTTGPGSSYYLSHTAAGQEHNSPCINAGAATALSSCYQLQGEVVCMNELTTRSDGYADSALVDMGYHSYPSFYPTPAPTAEQTPWPSRTPVLTTTPTATPIATATPTPTFTPILPHTATPTATGTPTVPGSPTPSSSLGVKLDMPLHVSPGESFWITAMVVNHGSALWQQPLCFALQYGDDLWFWPSWSYFSLSQGGTFDYERRDVPVGFSAVPVLRTMTWPDTGGDSLNGLFMHGAVLSQDLSALIGEMDSVAWEYGP